MIQTTKWDIFRLHQYSGRKVKAGHVPNRSSQQAAAEAHGDALFSGQLHSKSGTDGPESLGIWPNPHKANGHYGAFKPKAKRVHGGEFAYKVNAMTRRAAVSWRGWEAGGDAKEFVWYCVAIAYQCWDCPYITDSFRGPGRAGDWKSVGRLTAAKLWLEEHRAALQLRTNRHLWFDWTLLTTMRFAWGRSKPLLLNSLFTLVYRITMFNYLHSSFSAASFCAHPVPVLVSFGTTSYLYKNQTNLDIAGRKAGRLNYLVSSGNVYVTLFQLSLHFTVTKLA